MEYLNRIREKPHHVRKNWAIAITIVVGILLSVFWIFSFISSLNAPSFEAKAKANISPFKVLKESLLSTTQEVGSGIKNLKNSFQK